MLLLLPPSEGKTPGGTDPWTTDSGRFGVTLHELRTTVNNTLNNPDLPPPAGARRTNPVSLPAYQRYSGVVWKHLNPTTFTAETFRRASDHVAVVSAVGGLFAFTDPVPEYKLKVGASLRQVGSVAKLWQSQLGAAIDEELRREPHDGQHYVVDLLALEQAAAVRRPEGLPWYRVELIGPGGQRSGHNGKAAKGRLARALLDADDPEQFLRELLHGAAALDLDGWAPHLLP